MCKLDNIYKKEVECLEDGVKNAKNPYHTFTFSSINIDYPESRTVVLRGFEPGVFKIYFNTDYRSPKIQELKNNNHCSALFYDQERRVQLRFRCQAILHYQNDVSSKVWSQTHLQSRKCYMGPYKPTQKLEDWNPNIPLEYLKVDPEKEHSEDGYVNFVHIELKIIELDILELHHDGHVRFKTNNGIDFYYVAP